jgi:hypothetical protein
MGFAVSVPKGRNAAILCHHMAQIAIRARISLGVYHNTRLLMKYMFLTCDYVGYFHQVVSSFCPGLPIRVKSPPTVQHISDYY